MVKSGRFCARTCILLSLLVSVRVSISPLVVLGSIEWRSLGLGSSPPSLVYMVYVGAVPPLVPLVRAELHSLRLEVSVSPLVPFISVELHLLGLGS